MLRLASTTRAALCTSSALQSSKRALATSYINVPRATMAVSTTRVHQHHRQEGQGHRHSHGQRSTPPPRWRLAAGAGVALAASALVLGGHGLTVALAAEPRSYKEKVVTNYENRIRAMSAPEKVFELFASVHNESDDKQYMTPADFMRAITPFWSEADSENLKMSDFKYIRLCDTNDDGLLDFAEYIFFVTLLSIPKSQFTVAFKMFDLDGNGTVDADEFQQVLAVMRQRAPHGSQQRSDEVSKGGMFTAFFGENGDKKLSAKEFHQFLHGLQLEVRRLQFNNMEPDSKGLITPAKFGKSLVSFGLVRKIDEYYARIDSVLDDSTGTVSWKDYKDFHEALSHMDQLIFGLNLVADSGRGVTPEDFARAVRVAANVELSPAVIEVVFKIFDYNLDGHFQVNDFEHIMRHANRYGLDKPRDVGFVRWVTRVWECAKE